MASLKKYSFSYLLAAGMLAVILHIFLLTHTGIDFDTAVADALTTTIIIGLCIWRLSLLIAGYPTRVGIIAYAVILACITGLFANTIVYYFLHWFISGRPEGYRQWLKQTFYFRLLYTMLICGWSATAAAFRKAAAELHNKLREKEDAAALLREAELHKLRQQLQPHFLYNSLNSISALTIIEPHKAQEMIGNLSDFLRSSVKREAQETLPLIDEINYIKTYLDIEAVRFGDRLNIHLNNNADEQAAVIPFVLQPVLENAIKFGLYGKTGAVDITLDIENKGDMLFITITNPYDNDSQPPAGTGFGLQGIRRRMYLLYGRTDLLEAQKKDNVFTTVIKIPQAHV